MIGQICLDIIMIAITTAIVFGVTVSMFAFVWEGICYLSRR